MMFLGFQDRQVIHPILYNNTPKAKKAKMMANSPTDGKTLKPGARVLSNKTLQPRTPRPPTR